MWESKMLDATEVHRLLDVEEAVLNEGCWDSGDVTTIEDMDGKRKGKNAVQARKKLTDVYGEGVLTVPQCQD
ncbi:hypothetical protein TNCV_61021 [Trichonephila clavipes]|nr:hypothetical protein TNCV_61021 [Trichonephila clavipes]